MRGCSCLATVQPILLAVLVVFVVGCAPETTSSNAQPPPAAGSPKVPITTVVAGNVQHVSELSATVVGYESVQLMSKIDGYVGKVNVDIGDRVRQGQLLAELDVPELNDEVRRQQRLVRQAASDVESRGADIDLAEAKLEEQSVLLKLRKTERDRTAMLVEGGSLSQQLLDEAQFQVDAVEATHTSAKAEVEAAKAHYASAQARREVTEAELQKAQTIVRYTEIRAPFDGLITQRMVDPGAFVRPATSGSATALFDITRVDHVRVVIYLPMDEAGQLDVGDHVELYGISALPGSRVSSVAGKPLTVSRLSRSFDKASRMMRAEIDVDNLALIQQSGISLKPGDYGKIRLVLESYDGAPTVPVTAVGVDAKHHQFVVRVDEHNVCTRVPVGVLYSDEDFAVLDDSSGIGPGDRIVQRQADQVENQSTLQVEQIEIIAANGREYK